METHCTHHEMALRKRISWVVIALLVLLAVTMGHILQEKADQARTAEEKFALAVDGSAAGLWFWRPSMPLAENMEDYVWYSPNFLNMVGETQESFPARLGSIFDKLHPDDVAYVREEFQKHITDDKKHFDATFRMRVFGKWRWFYAHANYHTHTSQPTIAGSIFDITERVEQRARAETIINSAPVAMVLADQSGRITMFNPEAAKLFGYSAAYMMDKPVELLVVERERAAHQACFANAVRDLLSMEGDWQATVFTRGTGMREDGEELPLDIRVRGIRYGERVEFIATLTQQETTTSHQIEPAPERPLPFRDRVPRKESD